MITITTAVTSFPHHHHAPTMLWSNDASNSSNSSGDVAAAAVDPLVEELVRYSGGYLLEDDHDDDEEEDDEQQSTAHAVGQVRCLLKAGVNVNATNREGINALWAAVTSFRVDIVRVLLQEGGASVHNNTSILEDDDEEQQGEETSMLCYFLALLNLGDMAFESMFLLNHHLYDDDDDDDDDDDEDEDDPSGSRFDDQKERVIVSIVRLLLQHGADFTTHDCNGMLPLHYASLLRHDMPGIALALLEHGADPNVAEKNCLSVASYDEDDDDEDDCSSSSSKTEPQGSSSSSSSTTTTTTTPLEYAVQEGNVRVLRVLLEHGADPNAKDRDGSTLLHLACTAKSLLADNNNTQPSLSLLSPSLSPSLSSFSSSVSSSRGNVEILKGLLAHGADSSARDAQGELPLQVACKSGDLDAIFELLKHGDFNLLLGLGRRR